MISIKQLFPKVKVQPFSRCFKAIFRQNPLHLVVHLLYFPSKPQFRIIITTSTFPVPGNISTPHTFSTRYPLSCSTTRSLTRLVGLQDIYTIRSTPKSMIFPSAFGWIPSLGGSTTIRSGLSFRPSITFSTSPAMNSQLSSPFSPAFSPAASTASSTISTPTTFLATGARIWAMVPVPL